MQGPPGQEDRRRGKENRGPAAVRGKGNTTRSWLGAASVPLIVWVMRERRGGLVEWGWLVDWLIDSVIDCFIDFDSLIDWLTSRTLSLSLTLSSLSPPVPPLPSLPPLPPPLSLS